MKKIVLYIVAILIMLAAAVAAVVYRWMQTPYGQLNPIMAILRKLLGTSYTDKMIASGNLEPIRRNMNRVRPRVRVAAVEDRAIVDGQIPIRIYTPEGNGPFPVVLFYHGGGFVLGSIDSHENVARSVAKAGRAIVVSVDYRLAPEHPFPAPFDDAYTALLWVSQHAAEFNGDASRLAVAGDSAGGNLAAAVALKARDEGGPVIGLQILLYAAVTLTEMEFDSRRDLAGYILHEQMGYRMRKWYVPDEAEWSNPYVSPLLAGDHSNLPPAYIMTAEFDPLRDEGRAYADRLRRAGVPVTYRNYAGMLHGFLSFADLVALVPFGHKLLKEPDAVYADIAKTLEKAFKPSANLERQNQIRHDELVYPSESR